MNVKRSLLMVLLILSATHLCHSQTSSISPAQEMRVKLQNGQFEISNYNTACYFALSGDKDMAFLYLKKAINGDGFADLKTIKNDTDFNSLHDDARWAEILKDAEQVASKSKKTAGMFFNQNSFWESKALKTAYQPNLTENEKVAGLSKFWSEVKYNFVNFDLVPQLNIDSLYLAYLPKVVATTSTLDYYKVLSQFCAYLKDGHTNVYAPSELSNELYARPLLRSRLIGDKVIVIGVFDPELAKQGIKVGQEIVTVNGMPVREYANANVIPYQSASTSQDMDVRAYDYALFAGSLNEPIKVALRDGEGAAKLYNIRRVTPAERSKYLNLPAFEFKMLKGNIAYVALNTFGTDSAAIAFAKNYPEISKANAIIFDVRNNGGGNSSVGWKILGYLVDQPKPIHSWYTREYKPSYRAWASNQKVFGGNNQLYPNGKELYSKPVIVLTSARSFSAAEDFAAAFKSIQRGMIIGTATGGSSGQPLSITMPGNGSARICTKRDMLANGDDFVGKGIQPDKVVAPTLADIKKGVDTELEAALKELRK